MSTMEVSDVLRLRKQGRIEEAYEAIKPMYAVHKGHYTTIAMFWVGVDMMRLRYKSGKTKCDALIKRNVIFSCKTKCNKMETHTIPKGWFEPNIQTDLFLYIEFKLHILISVK